MSRCKTCEKELKRLRYAASGTPRKQAPEYREAWKAKHPKVPEGVEHGKLSTYKNYGCRCGPCRTANAAYELKRKKPPHPERAGG